ncbi:MAG TPA: lipase family protein [Solirubrobacteraceae bacterium]|nr:lipase family protein [Solirubrobacteraceae bacterium]
MSRSIPALARRILVVVAAAALLAPAASAHAATHRTAPAGLRFYAPPSPLPAGRHGDVIWSRTITGPAALAHGARTLLVLYRSTALNGRPIAVSGTVTIPKGTPPRGGWPIVSWAHGTTGSADVCAPSRDAQSNPAHAYISYVNPVLDGWLRRGYVIARTDYEGLGTPGPHPYLIGHSEGRGVLDIARAARQLDPRVGRRLVVAGHSQGGQAALFAAADAPTWTPDLRLRGVAAFAPASNIAGEVAAAKLLTAPSGLSGLGGMILDSAVRAAGIDPASVASPAAVALLPQVQQKCLAQLSAADSWGALAPASIIRDDADLTKLDTVLNAMDPTLKIAAPVLLMQGTNDTTVFKSFTDALDTRLVAKGDTVTYTPYQGVDHGGIVTAGAGQTATWLAQRLG